MPDFQTVSLHRNDTTCPTCAAPAEEGQLVCLECGSRVALDYRRPPGWRVPAAILVTVVLLVLGGTALTIKRIGDDAEREVSRTPVKVEGRAGAKPAPPAKPRNPASSPATAGRTPAAGRQLVKRGVLYSWPPELRAYTVVLRSARDRPSAESFARSASEGAPARIGVIRSDDFKSLRKGSYLVFAGQYPERGAADRATARLEPRFSGAYPQLVGR